MIPMTHRLAPLALLLALAACGAPPSTSTASADPAASVGRAALDSGSPELAMQVSENLLRANPMDTQALLLRADALSALGRAAEAMPIYHQIIAADPRSVPAKLGLGRALLAVDAAAAETMFLAVLDADPKNAPAANNLGIARDLQNRHAEAQIAYRRALAMAPAMQAAAVNLALSLGLSGQTAEALPLLRPIAQAPGAAPRVRHDLAAVLAMAGERGSAAKMLSPDMSQPQVEKALGMYAALRPDSPHTARAAVNISPDSE